MSDSADESSPEIEKLPKYATTQAELAQYIHVHRNTVISWLKEPDAPKQRAKGYEVLEWLEFKSKMDKRNNAAKGDSKRAKEIEKLDEQIRGLKLENDKRANLLVSMAMVREIQVALNSEFNQEVRKIEDGLPQALAGLGLPEQRIKIREYFDGLRTKIHKGSLPLTGENPSPKEPDSDTTP
jgi:hypothetical protein